MSIENVRKGISCWEIVRSALGIEIELSTELEIYQILYIWISALRSKENNRSIVSSYSFENTKNLFM